MEISHTFKLILFIDNNNDNNSKIRIIISNSKVFIRKGNLHKTSKYSHNNNNDFKNNSKALANTFWQHYLARNAVQDKKMCLEVRSATEVVQYVSLLHITIYYTIYPIPCNIHLSLSEITLFLSHSVPHMVFIIVILLFGRFFRIETAVTIQKNVCRIKYDIF